jgi:hypothetical protein
MCRLNETTYSLKMYDGSAQILSEVEGLTRQLASAPIMCNFFEISFN